MIRKVELTKKQKEKIKCWNKQQTENRKLFNQIISFLKKNHEFTSEYLRKATKKTIPEKLKAKEKLYFIFIDCLRAAGGNNLTNNGESSENFIKILNKLGESRSINFKAFLSQFSDKPENTEQLFNSLTTFRNIGNKKAALFMKELFYCQSINSNRIFKDLKPQDINKPIPLDVIIADLVNKMLKLKNEINPSRDFLIFNDWAKGILLDDYYLLEDLWFWGYFGTKVEKGKGRIVDFNPAKYFTNPWFCPINDKHFIDKVNEFCKFFH